MSAQPRSRIFRRCCPRRSESSGEASTPRKFKLPETPLILAGALGGPFCIFFLTPLRNAITLASQDSESSAMALYGSVFQGGFSSGWTGGFVPVIPSCPQFCVMGPTFHFLKSAVGTVAAVFLSAAMETTISFASQTRNAQLAYNLEQEFAGKPGVELTNAYLPWGPGMTPHVMRNIVALSGIRIFSGPCQVMISKLAKTVGLRLPLSLQQFLGDFVASMGSAVLSAPLNQCFNFAVTSEEYRHADFWGRIADLTSFLEGQYLSHGPDGEITGLSSVLIRDLAMRCAYVATLYTLFGCIERTLTSLWRRFPKSQK